MIYNYHTEYRNWLTDPVVDDATKAELKNIADDQKEIEDRFYKDLEFGTGGLRGILGAGTNRLNIYTIRKATQGLANYILSSDVYKEGMAVAIAHDCRRMSPEFSIETALVLNANGIKTYTFDSLRPTPLLSFAVRHLGCVAGIVITASHNPPEYNGYKVYWSDGGQCTSPRDKEIMQEVQNVNSFAMVKTMLLAEAKTQKLFNIAPASVDDTFIAKVKARCFNCGIIPDSDIKVVFTPLHGAGNVSVQRALGEIGFKNVYVVKEQEQPDGNFPTVKYPNPEEIKAFSYAINLAKEKDADIVLATDPDCDRVGVAVKHDNEYILLTGNQTGVILLEYLITQMQTRGKLPSNGAVISTIVSTDMARIITEANGLTYIDVLTGFKYIGEKIKQFEEIGNHEFIFGFEESYGYLADTYARDKDAVGATVLICEAAAYYRKQGLSLYAMLQKLYEKYGMFYESMESITLKGVDGVENIKKIMANLRQAPPQSLANSEVIEVRDYLHGTITKRRPISWSIKKPTTEVEQTAPTMLPVSDVLYFASLDGSWACVRPSGTEPKIKIYFGVRLPSDSSQQEVQDKLSKVITSMMALINR